MGEMKYEKKKSRHTRQKNIARGVKFGRNSIERPALFPALREKWLNGKISARAAAKQLNVAHSTFLRWCHE